ncbi:hypothetical protein PGTUg99_026024 [Puccinia graminis f. sp. tritici]|uniref:Uncharacterized protein n=1 Tax=Puccinia graminis f. sp. tritici TaxID=56615 RepID=A0A5B0MA04_PUCGR|nr:hypothetical protein PGTUg99_026024 [Puccinia graminis f. sp. tritici]
MEEIGSRSRLRISLVLIGIEIGTGPLSRTRTRNGAASLQPCATPTVKLEPRTTEEHLGPLPRGFFFS